MGRRYAGRRHAGDQREILVHERRPPAYRAAAPRRAIHPHRHEHDEVRGHHRRSRCVHPALVFGLDAAVGGRRGAPRLLLPGQPAMNILRYCLRNSFMHRFLVLASVLVMLPLAMTSTVSTQDEQPPNLNPGQGQGRGGGRGGGQGRGAPQGPPKPAPRWPDGQINLGQVEGGGTGLWEGGATSLPLARADKAEDFGLFAADMREPTDPFLATKPKLSQIPFQPWARSLFAARVLTRQEPYTRCKPSSGARQVATAYGTQFVEVPELKIFYIVETGGAHSFR